MPAFGLFNDLLVLYLIRGPNVRDGSSRVESNVADVGGYEKRIMKNSSVRTIG